MFLNSDIFLDLFLFSVIFFCLPEDTCLHALARDESNLKRYGIGISDTHTYQTMLASSEEFSENLEYFFVLYFNLRSIEKNLVIILENNFYI